MRKLLLMLLFMVPVAIAIETSNIHPTVDFSPAYFQVVATKYEPYPAEPGSYVDVWLKVRNIGNVEAKDFTLTLKPAYPFSLDPNEAAERSLGEILAGESATVHYKVKVDENAVEGDTELDFVYTTGTSVEMDGAVTIKIQTIDAVLSVDSVKTIPESVVPGEAFDVKIKFTNNADSYLKYVSVGLPLINPATHAELPFTPVGGGIVKTLYQVGPGEETEFTFKLVANPDAESKPYKLPVIINYYDDLGRLYNLTNIVGIIVGSEPDIFISVDSSTIYGKRQTGDLVLKVVNKGLTGIKFVNINLKDSEDYDILSPKEVYIGSVDSDDYETADFKVYVKGFEDSTLKLPLSMEYMDANNNPYQKDLELEFTVYSAKKLGASSGSSLGTIIFILIILVIAYFIYRRWEKKKRKVK
jgi:hypothetical protein